MSRKALIAIAVISTVICISVVSVTVVWSALYKNNINHHENGVWEVLIPTSSSYEDVLLLLSRQNVLRNERSFNIVAKRMKYDKYVKPGRYLLIENSNNLETIRKLISGKQDPVRLVVNNADTAEQIADKVSEKLECTKEDILATLYSEDFLDKVGLNFYNVISVIISNTYEFYWNTSASGFLDRMVRESNIFWNEDRLIKAKGMGFSPAEVITLASIVQKESNKVNEYRDIAGVYINRLKKNWPLQADPTVKFALGDPGLKRILLSHTQIDSPYNTYRNVGLPPGPICLPEIYAIDAVLNARDHEYMFFCAKDDFSGYHVFAKTLSEHNANARKYHRALNERRIF